MLCYSFLEKRGDYIKKFINWKLISNNNEVVNNEFVECEFVNDILKYLENDTMNIIDLNKNIYIRENDEFTFEIDFNNRLFNYILKKEELSIENAVIDAEIKKNNSDILLKYNLGDEIKEIIIQLL